MSESVYQRLSRLYLNMAPLASMAFNATRKSDRQILSDELQRIRLVLGGIMHDTRAADLTTPVSKLSDREVIFVAFNALWTLMQRHIEIRERAVEQGDGDQVAVSAAKAAACETLIGAMRAFWDSELHDA